MDDADGEKRGTKRAERTDEKKRTYPEHAGGRATCEVCRIAVSNDGYRNHDGDEDWIDVPSLH